MESNDTVVDSICQYAEEKEIHALLKEYMRRLIVEQPRDPLKYLISSIEEKPYVVKKPEGEGATPTADDAPAAPDAASTALP